MSFYERYQSGDRERVWQELLALGRDVREKTYYSDALAVARETMVRARDNVETLISRLHKVGYKFQTAADTFADFAVGVPRLAAQQLDAFRSNQLPSLEALGETTGMDPAQVRIHLERIANPKALEFLGAMAAAMPKAESPLNEPSIYMRAPLESSAAIAEAERRLGGPLPISLRAWYEHLGHVSFVGSHPALNPVAQGPLGLFGPPKLLERPLDVLVLGPISELTEYLKDDPGEATGVFPAAADGAHEVYLAGCHVSLPDSRADIAFEDQPDEYFLPYLRRALKWGGFPGWERHPNPPTALLNELTEGLLAI